MNFAKNIGGPIILNTNDHLYGCPVVYAEDDAIFDGCLDKITLASGKKIHFAPMRTELIPLVQIRHQSDTYSLWKMDLGPSSALLCPKLFL